MAKIYPNFPVGSLPSEVIKSFRFFASLPDTFSVWHKLSSERKAEPDFLIMDEGQHAVLVRINVSQKLSLATQLLLFPQEVEETIDYRDDERILSKYIIDMQSKYSDLHNLISVILFPNYSTFELSQKGLTNSERPPFCLGNDCIKQKDISYWIRYFVNSATLDAKSLHLVRQFFCPEITIPTELTASVKPNQASTEGFLLDYEQEWITKLDLELPSEQRRVMRNFDINVVNGVAGSGKTLILLYRLKLLHQFNPHGRFLVLTHNKPLILDIQRRYSKLIENRQENVAFYTFMQFCRYLWPDDEEWIDPIGADRREALIRRIWEKHFSKSAITSRMFTNEINWFKDHWFETEEEYLHIDRKGVGFSVSSRRTMLTAITDYQNQLKAMKLVDWADIPSWVMEFLQKGKIYPQKYDFIFVDEGQFFAPLWFEIIRHVLNPQGGRIFIAVDPKQGFLGRGSSWREMGFEVRGHSHYLSTSYRTTREILNFSTLFYRERVSDDSPNEELVEPDMLNMRMGIKPTILQVDKPQDEIFRVVDEICNLHNQGISLGDFLVLHNSWKSAKTIITLLRQRLGVNCASDPKDCPPGDFIRVTTINAGTGIESPIVVLSGLYQMFESEQNLRLSDEERGEVIKENTRKLYMAFTRAGQRIIFTYVGDLPEAITKLLE